MFGWLKKNALDLLGLGSGALADSSARRMHKRQLKQAQHQFDEQMDASVQRRVADAQKAGIHPLFALGASSGASPTITGGQAPSGSHMTEALKQLARNNSDESRARARRDEAEAAYLDAQTGQLRGAAISQGRDGSLGDKTTPEFDVYAYPGLPQGSKKPGVGHARGHTGPIPQYIEYRRTDGSIGKMMNPELGADEIGQIHYVVNEGGYSAHRIWNNIQGFMNSIGPKRTNKLLSNAVQGARKDPEGHRKIQTFFKDLEKMKLKDFYNKYRNMF